MYEDLIDALLKELKEARENFKDTWASGGFTTETSSGTAQLNAEWIGRAQMAAEIIDMIEDAKKEYEGE